MKRIKFIAAALTLMIVTGGWAQDNGIEFLHDFLPGTYDIVGRWPDSSETYTGTVVIENRGGHFLVSRMVNGEKIHCVGRITDATGDKIKVLTVNFFQNNRAYAATYLINSDLDNTARLTGYIYLKTGGTKQPGLEALFIHQQP
jgi:hypothetical protein